MVVMLCQAQMPYLDLEFRGVLLVHHDMKLQYLQLRGCGVLLQFGHVSGIRLSKSRLKCVGS